MDDFQRQVRDEWLALRCQAGEAEAFADLVREFERPLLYFAAKIVNSEDSALEALQEAWLIVFRTIRRLDRPTSLRAWLYRIVRGRAVDRVRRDVVRQRAEESQTESFDEADEPVDFDAEDAARVHHALDQLDVKHREVLVLHFLEELPVEEVASILDCPPGTVKSRVHYAKRALRDVLERGK